jgi:hypothetical protein
MCYPSRLATVKRRQQAESSRHATEDAQCAKGSRRSVALEGFNAHRESYMDK